MTAAKPQSANPTAAVLAKHPALARFLAETQRLYIDGRWKPARSGATFPVLDPGTGVRIAECAAAAADDVAEAVEAAGRTFAHGGWRRLPANDRGVVLHRLADLIERDAELIVALESLDVGKPLAQAAGFDVPHAAKTIRYYADLAVGRRQREPIAVAGHEARSVRTPYGPCAFIFPWNFPFMLVGWGIAPALAAGNTVVIKPAEDTSLSTLWFCRLAEEAGIPAGVVNVVTGLGEVAGAALARHPGIRRMSFTGSPEIGREIARACGENLVPAKLELGGKGAAVLFDDVDAEAAARSLCGAITLNSGQVCCTATRWIVHRRIWDRFVDTATATLKQVAIGHGSLAGTQMGPVVSAKQRERVLGYVSRGRAEGAQALLPGGPATVAGAEGGFYVQPSLLTGAPDNICAREEVFGPFAYLMPFEREDEAIALVNRSSYGLANSVWSADLGRANRVGEALVAGNTWINAHNVFPIGVQYGGCNLSGLGGGVLGPETLDDYLRPQSIVRPLP
jgi:aldehyde dehydrogenase (NAD+)